MNLSEEIVVGIPYKNTSVDEEDFPSKVGGTPKWLALEGFPQPTCTKCSNPLKFVLQVYAPLEEIKEAYYRTLYLFVCNQEECRNKDHSVRIFRNQLAFENKYYTETEEGDLVRKGENPSIPIEHILTKNTFGIETIIIDVEESKKIEEAIKNAPKPGDFDDIDEDEEDDDESKTSEDYRHENELLKQYLEAEKTEEGREMGKDFGDLVNDLDKAQRDEKFIRFTKFCASHPNQILRYCRSEESEPLWVSDQKVPDVTKVPKCSICGSKKIFELQINCQLLHYIPELTMCDWGVLAIYTCKKSCAKKEEDYIEESIVIQLNVQELELDDKALQQILAAQKEAKKEEGNGENGQEKKKKKKKKNKKKQPQEESKGSEDEWEEEEDIKEIKEVKEEEDGCSESDWM